MFGLFKKTTLVTAEEALPGRIEEMPVANRHTVTGNAMRGPWPEGHEVIMFGMGCFWGAERKFWQLDGVYSTSVGYSAGFTKNPTYQEVCSGRTAHNEVVLVVYSPELTTLDALLKVFWESHDPTQGMRQGNDVGTQYRSGIYTYSDEQRARAEASRDSFQSGLSAAGYSAITTEICPATAYYYAEDYHQQYLAKNPNGYCGLGGTGVVCQSGIELDRE